MTAAEIAKLLEGRRAGAGWMAKCPAHDDRRESLSLGQGARGWVVHCFAGCEPADVMRAFGLTMRDLFDGPPPSPAQLAAKSREEEERDAVRLQRKWDHGRVCELLIAVEQVVNDLGAQLARLPDGDPAEQVRCARFHSASSRLMEVTGLEMQFRETKPNDAKAPHNRSGYPGIHNEAESGPAARLERSLGNVQQGFNRAGIEARAPAA